MQKATNYKSHHFAVCIDVAVLFLNSTEIAVANKKRIAKQSKSQSCHLGEHCVLNVLKSTAIIKCSSHFDKIYNKMKKENIVINGRCMRGSYCYLHILQRVQIVGAREAIRIKTNFNIEN